MIKSLKLTKRIIICFIVSCFIGILGITTTYALDLDGIKTVEELTAVRAAGKNINDNNDDFVNGKRTNEKSLLTFTGGFTTNDNEKYTTNFGERRDTTNNNVLQVPETYAASDRNANSDPSWINRTVLINNLGNSTLQVYLAQGNVARTSTVSSNYEAKEKANKMFLAWQRFANGATEGAVPNNSTAWYNSNLSILHHFTTL